MKGRRGIACIIAFTLMVAGCSSGGGSASPAATSTVGLQHTGGGKPKLTAVNLPNDARQLGALVQQQTSTTQSVRISATTSTNGAGGKASIEITGALLKVQGAGNVATLKVVEVGGKEPGTTHVMVGNGVLFTKVEGETYGRGKEWLVIRKEDLSNPNVRDLSETYRNALGLAVSAMQQTSSDMGSTVLSYGRLTRTPEWEKLDGVDVYRYTGTTKTEDLTRISDDPQLRQMAAGGFRDYPWTMWVDKFGLPRQYVSTITVPKAGSITSRAYYSGWGEKVTISFPGPNDVAGLDDV
jgi:hypothetical protein